MGAPASRDGDKLQPESSMFSQLVAFAAAAAPRFLWQLLFAFPSLPLPMLCVSSNSEDRALVLEELFIPPATDCILSLVDLS